MSHTVRLRVRGVHKMLGSTLALAGVDLEARAGEVVGVLGPNGAGKSTLLHVVAGLLAPDAGAVEIEGRADPMHREVRARLGFAPQRTAVYDELTVEENLAFFGRLHGLSSERLRAAVERAVVIARLDERRAARASTLSGGMRRRLHVASALVHGPSLLLLDEPTVGVDAESRRHLHDAVRTLGEEGSTVVIVSHDPEEVTRLCERVVVLERGRVASTTVPRTSRAAPQLVTGGAE